MGSLAFAAALACLLVLAGAASASTAVRFAAPGGNGATPCAEHDKPCSLFDAASVAAPTRPAQPGDEIVLAPGVYSSAAGDLGPQGVLILSDGVVLHGEPDRARPQISLNLDELGRIRVGAGDLVSHLEIESAVSGEPLLVGGGIVDDVVVRGQADESVACGVSEGTIRDSACIATGNASAALSASGLGPTVDRSVTLRNVNALALEPNSLGLVVSTSTGAKIALSAKAVIAQGSEHDVEAFASDLGSSSSASLEGSDFRNFAVVKETGGAASVTDAGSAGNIVAPALLAADGLHELPGSPTVDRGVADAASGNADIDGQLRVLGAATDIGADELAVPTATTVACAPATVLNATASTCTATVAPTRGTVVPSGRVRFGSAGAGAFSAGATCTLSPAGPGRASCQLTYTPSAVGPASHRITAAYPGALSGFEPSLGSTLVGVSGRPTPATKPPAPNTTLKKQPRKKSAARLARFQFVSDQPGSSFQCKVDRKPFKPCRSPLARRLKPGRHVFAVRAVSEKGVPDPTPAAFHWTITRG